LTLVLELVLQQGGERSRSAGKALPLALLFALLAVGGCAGRRRALELYPELARYSGRQIEKVNFEGASPFGRDTLLALIETKPSHCSLLGLPVCVPFTSVGRRIYRFSLDRVHEDVVRLRMFYRYSGFFGTTVKPDVEEDGKEVNVTFKIQRGDSIMLRKFTVTGTAGILDPDSLEQKLPLKEGRIFHLGQFNRSAEQILVGLRSRGHAYAQVLRNFSVDTLNDRAEATLKAVPGPRVVVDSIVVEGAKHLGRRAALRQLSFRKGDILRNTKLVESQRNLYSLELVQLATVTLAPDSLDATPRDSTRATVIVSIVEARRHQVDAAVGWGSIECFRTEAQYVNRSFTGGARRLAVTGSLSKIGLGGVTNIGGLGKSICRAFDADTFENSLDYRLAVDFTQPYFLSPRNHLSLTVFVERESEPRIFQREAQGGGVVITRRLAPRFLLTGGVDIEHGKTIASPVVFCTAFEVCVPETIEQLTHPRWRNTFGINASRDRTDVPLDPTRGSIVRSGFAWATPALNSDVTFLRWTAEGSVYRQLRPAWVAAFSLRAGTFFNTATIDPTDDFLPPEERFYAGGAYTVRGYGRNELGPGVYVTDSVEVETESGLVVPADGSRFVPLGGTAMGIANVELRFPSPIYPRRFRMAAFVDAGALGSGKFLEMGGWRVTPGLGLRIQTPVGPARVDVAYNPYPNPAGPLYLELDDALVRVRDEFRPERGGFFSRFRIHLAVGQAF
jgi:outer membrane protein insertion porin family